MAVGCSQSKLVTLQDLLVAVTSESSCHITVGVCCSSRDACDEVICALDRVRPSLVSSGVAAEDRASAGPPLQQSALLQTGPSWQTRHALYKLLLRDFGKSSISSPASLCLRCTQLGGGPLAPRASETTRSRATPCRRFLGCMEFIG